MQIFLYQNWHNLCQKTGFKNKNHFIHYRAHTNFVCGNHCTEKYFFVQTEFFAKLKILFIL